MTATRISVMICEVCGQGRVTQVSTLVVGGKKQVSYLCESCRGAGPVSHSLERPCSRCRHQEGTVKLVRMEGSLRTVSYVCEACASAGGRKE